MHDSTMCHPRPPLTVVPPQSHPQGLIAPSGGRSDHPAWTVRLVVLGAHGGAGASTVATLLDPGGTGWAVEGNLSTGQVPAGRRPVLVARSTGYGVAEVARVLTRWRARLGRPVLVLVADAATPPPLSISYRLAALHSLIAGVVPLPYLARLRAISNPRQLPRLACTLRVGAQLRIQLLAMLYEGGDDRA